MVATVAMTRGGLSTSGLARLHETMAGFVDRGELPGLVTLVARREDVHVNATGNQAFGSSAPMERRTIFRIASFTKPIAAAAAMILVEECRLRLDDPIDPFVPELANRRVLTRIDGPVEDTVPARRSITTRDLLTLRLGFGHLTTERQDLPILEAERRAGISLGPPRPDQASSADHWIRRLGTLPLMYHPGDSWMYDTGLDVLGVLIARAAQQPLDVFLKERLFKPLGMTDTGFAVPHANLDRLATAYTIDARTSARIVYDPPDGAWSHPPAFPSAASGLVSTVDDYLAFGRMMLNKGIHNRIRILSRASVEAMTTNHLTPQQLSRDGLVPGYFDSHGWGFGLSMVTRRVGVAGSVGAFGWDGGLGTSWVSDPAEDLVGILMTQVAWTSPKPPEVCEDFWTCVYSAIAD